MLAPMTDDPNSGDRVRRSVRLDPAGWLVLCRIADAYWEGKRHPAIDAALLDALMHPVAIPDTPSPEFNAHLSTLIEHLAQRLIPTTKKFHFGEDVTKALLAAVVSYPKIERAPGAPLPFVRRLPSGSPPVPTAPWALTCPIQFSGKLPEADLRPFVDAALLHKATRLGLDAPEKILPTPRSLPSLESALTTRHLDESLVAILAALPVASVIHDDRLHTTLRWLRSNLLMRA